MTYLRADFDFADPSNAMSALRADFDIDSLVQVESANFVGSWFVAQFGFPMVGPTGPAGNASSHTHPANQISDSTGSGRTLLTSNLVGARAHLSLFPSFADRAAFPATGDVDRVYTALDTSKIYVWVPSSSTYVEVSPQVKADWNATSGDAEILNKPSSLPPSAHNHDDLYFNAAVPWTANHTIADGTRYLAGDVVYSGGRIYRAKYDNESMPVTEALYWEDLGPGNRLNIDGRDIANIPNHDDRYYTETETDTLLNGKISVPTTVVSTYNSSQTVTLTARRHAYYLVEANTGATVQLTLPPASSGTLVGDIATFARLSASPFNQGTITVGSTIIGHAEQRTFRYTGDPVNMWNLLEVDTHTHPFSSISDFPVEYVIACSNETTALTSGVAKVTFRAPVAFRLTSVAASVTVAPTGLPLVVDINNGSNSVLSNIAKLSIDATEKTSATAATAAVILANFRDFTQDAEITIDIDQVGSTVAGAGLKVILRGTRL